MNNYSNHAKTEWAHQIIMPDGFGKIWAKNIARGTDTRPEHNTWNGYPYIAELLILAEEVLRERQK